jgi:hypothetical protein
LTTYELLSKLLSMSKWYHMYSCCIKLVQKLAPTACAGGRSTIYDTSYRKPARTTSSHVSSRWSPTESRVPLVLIYLFELFGPDRGDFRW